MIKKLGEIIKQKFKRLITRMTIHSDIKINIYTKILFAVVSDRRNSMQFFWILPLNLFISCAYLTSTIDVSDFWLEKYMQNIDPIFSLVPEDCKNWLQCNRPNLFQTFLRPMLVKMTDAQYHSTVSHWRFRKEPPETIARFLNFWTSMLVTCSKTLTSTRCWRMESKTSKHFFLE